MYWIALLDWRFVIIFFVRALFALPEYPLRNDRFIHPLICVSILSTEMSLHMNRQKTESSTYCMLFYRFPSTVSVYQHSRSQCSKNPQSTRHPHS